LYEINVLCAIFTFPPINIYNQQIKRINAYFDRLIQFSHRFFNEIISHNRYYEKIGNEKPKCIDDELSFDIPDSWRWVRINNYVEKVTDFVASGSFASLRENVKYYKTENYALLVKTQDFANNFTKDLTYTDEYGYNFLSNSNIFGGELILSNVGSIGKIFIVPKLNRPATLAPNSIMVRCFDILHINWLYVIFCSAFGLDMLLSISSATAIKKFNKTGFKSLIIPIPPLAEQERIVAEIKKYEPLIAEYYKFEQEKSKLDSEIYDKLKKSILQYAIQGKLVPQDKNDEPASELLKRIRAEKKAQLGKKYVDSYIYKGDDNCYYEHIEGKTNDEAIEIPFDLPNNWCWCRCEQYLDVRDGTHDTPKYVDNGFPLVTSKNLCDGSIDFTSAKLITKNDLDSINARSKVESGDILFAMIGSIGNPVKVIKERDFAIKNMALFKPLTQSTNMDHVLYFLIYIQEVMKTQSSGAVQQFVSLNYLRNFLIPIPPLAEQQRIVDKLNKIFAKL